MLRGFVIGAVASPFLLLVLAYGLAFPGWALFVLGLLAAPFVGIFIYQWSHWRDPLPCSTEASRTDAPPPVHRIYRVETETPPRRWPRRRRR